MKCHYEVLNVARDADISEIKSSYRKCALKWHPDKNLDNIEYAKEQFQLVQQAYEVLSDQQERAWYDKHREQILRGSNSEFQDNSLDVFPYFTTTCFKGYGDDDKGFYTVYRNVFDQIIKEDLEFIDNKEEFCQIPGFGNSQSDYDGIVGKFYSYWMSYCTKKSYVWLDPYDIKEIKDRRYLKLVEKENKKVRTKAKKERNEEIRNLVAFVRKRDKRVQENTKRIENKIIGNRQKQEQLSKQKRLERNKQLLNESNEQAEWVKFDNLKSQLEEIEKSLAEEFGEEFSDDSSEEFEDENNIINNLYCVACNKIFKTLRAFENHEFSKKHRENSDKLTETMLKEEEEEKTEIAAAAADADLDEELIEIETNNDSVEFIEEEDEEKSRKKKKKNKKAQKTVLQIDSEEEVVVEEVPADDLELSKIERTVDDDFDSSTTAKKQKKKNFKKNKTISSKSDNTAEINNKISEDSSKNYKKNRNKKENNDLQEIDLNHCCVICKSNFNSKNKLFDHLKKTGHSVYLPTSNNKSKKSKLLLE